MTVGPRARVTAVVAFFAYVVFTRTHDITGTFLLLGEQMRDWTLALGSWRDLPLTGAPSTAGGKGFGPAYYWVLWLGRHLIGPFADNLPHAGGVTICLLQAVGDTWLLVALARRLPFALALALGLLVATQPFEVGLSAAIWNPPVAAAFAKIAIALALGLDRSAPQWQVAATMAVAWLGVQAHSSGMFVAAPIAALLVLRPAFDRQWRRAAILAGLGVGVVGVLEIPYLIALARNPGDAAGPTVVLESLSNVAALDIPRSFVRVSSMSGWLIGHGDDAWPYWVGLLAAGAAVVWRWRNDPAVLAVSVGPVLTATALFATWQRPLESYWFMTLAPAVVVTIGFALAALPWARAREVLGIAILALVVVWQPSRVADSGNFFRYPQYRALLNGSRFAARRTPVVKELRAGFEVHETTDVGYLYRILGGRISPDGPFIATIQPDGTVTFTATAQP